MKTTKSMRGKFSRFIQPQPCGVCKKLTTYAQTQGLDHALCQRCYDGAGLENEHMDNGGHEPKEKGCPLCFPENFPDWPK